MRITHAQKPFFFFHQLFKKSFFKKKYLSLQTVFILNENIQWLEEFLIYYIHLGFEHFYLYDNEGSNGKLNNGMDKSYSGNSFFNKNGISRATHNKAEDLEKLKKILSKYVDRITYIKWQPRDEKGDIIYNQTRSIEHFISIYGHETQWVAFLDFDEFLFSKEDVSIVEFLKRQKKNVSCVKISQKKFIDRHLSQKRYVTQDFQCIESLEMNAEHRPKNIVRCQHFKYLLDVHQILVKCHTIIPDINIFRINHYHVNNEILKWMKGFYGDRCHFYLNSIDDGMKRYQALFERKNAKT